MQSKIEGNFMRATRAVLFIVFAVLAASRLPAGGTIDLTFTYGSEKKHWIADVTEQFNRAGKTVGGRKIVVKHIPMGSGESIDDLLAARVRAHLTSPASEAFIKLGNARSQAKTGKPLIGDTQNLVLSPVVIAMWKPMAEAIGWGRKPLGWGDIIELAKNPKGWAAYDHPEWGSFKFGHTHPEFSNSGLISLVAETYAGTGKKRGLTDADIASPKTAAYLRSIERAVVHYGSSTGFFGRKMFKNGPVYLSAAVLYENMVIESYSNKDLPFPVVAIYPKEGTFWSDHPVGIVQRPWVTAEHKKAAQAYIDYLLAAPQQKKALTYGFRPAEPAIKVTTPVDKAHGVDPAEPKATLEVPSAGHIEQIIKVWHKNKKHANIVLVLDISGSMSQGGKINGAKKGALEMVNMLGDEDTVSLMVFNNRITWLDKSVKVSAGRPKMARRIKGLFPGGGTALYDATNVAFDYLQKNRIKDTVSAVVVLTDGADTHSKMKFDALLPAIESDNETKTTRVFTIGYGSGAKAEKLTGIADATAAKYYKGTVKNIRDVFKDISTFF